MRRTLLIALLLTLSAAAAGGAWSYYVWNHSDELLRGTLTKKLEEMFPGWNMSIARARFDFQGRIHAHGFRLSTGEDRARFVAADEVILTVDGGRLADENPLIRRLEVIRPRIWLVREPGGQWNFSQLPALKVPSGVLPAWSFDRLLVSTRIERQAGLPAITTVVEDAQMQLTAIGRRQYRLKLAGRASIADAVKLDGTWHLDARTWQVTGQLGRLRIDDLAIAQISEFSPEFRTALARGCRLVRQRVDPAAAEQEANEDTESKEVDLGLSATADVELRLKQESPGTPLEYSATVQVLDGEVARPPVDFPLTDIRGRAAVDNERIVVEELTARSGPIGISVPTARVERVEDLRPMRLEARLTNLPLDDRVVALLPPTPRKLYLEGRPTGHIGVHLTAESDGASPWRVEWTIKPRDCTARHVEFSYLVEGIEGEISQRDGVVRAELRGTAGRQAIRMTGETINPGPEAESNYEIVVEGLPIDARLREASPPALQKVIDALQIQGTIGGRVLLKRPPGPKQPTVPVVDVTVRNGTLTPRPFPFQMTRATARIRGSGKSWKFTSCRAVHDRTTITCSGEYRPDENQIPRLKMKFSSEDVRFDRSLYEALPDDLRSLWYEVNPEGSCHVEGTLDWSPNQGRPRVELEAELLDAALSLRSFPYPLRNIHAWVTVSPGRVTMREFEGRHDETRLRTEAQASISDDGEWRFRCEPLHVDDLDVGAAFRRALPGSLRTVVDAFDLRGNVSLSGMLELRGVRGGDYPVTAAWSLATVYNGNTVTAGVELQEMHGRSQFTGTWDGEAVRAIGKISLNSVKVLGYQLQQVEGPIRIEEGQLVLGSRAVLERGNATEIPDGERLTAQFIDGVLAVDALIRLGEQMSYDVRVGLRNGLLERYNQLYMSGSGRLAGVINGVLYLTGKGSDFRQLKGNGRMVIEPADLYDLPLLLAIFRVLSLQSADAAAFDRAQFDFNVRNGLVLFDRINLQGESISLAGRGTVRMNDKRVKLDFYSASGRRQVPIPLIRELTNELSKGWVGVHVEGTLRDPRPETRPIPVLDDALKRLLGVFDTRPPTRRP